MTDTENQRAGFAAIIGAPNAGKSTLVNRLTGSKVSIVTQKVQTTRFPVRGIAMEGDAQIVLVDTPGIFTPRRRLDRAMVASACNSAACGPPAPRRMGGSGRSCGYEVRSFYYQAPRWLLYVRYKTNGF